MAKAFSKAYRPKNGQGNQNQAGSKGTPKSTRPEASPAASHSKKRPSSESSGPAKKGRLEREPHAEEAPSKSPAPSQNSTRTEPESTNDSPVVDMAAERNVALAALEAVTSFAENEKRDGSGHGIAAASQKDPSKAQQPLTKQQRKQQDIVASSNWLAIKKTFVKSRGGKKVTTTTVAGKASVVTGAGAAVAALAKGPGSLSEDSSSTAVVAIDCEMVGVGAGGRRSALARVCLVNNHGNVLIDLFAKPDEPVTDYRTWVSGVRPQDLREAPSCADVIEKVHRILRGRVVVGHALGNDFRALKLEAHPPELVRDTSKYPKLMRKLANGKLVPHSLKELSAIHLGIQIQAGEHTPVDDARCALYLYHKFRKEWDAAVKNRSLDKWIVREKEKALREAGVIAPKRNKAQFHHAKSGDSKGGAVRATETGSLRFAMMASAPKPDAAAAGNRNIFTAVVEDEQRKVKMMRMAARRAAGVGERGAPGHAEGRGGAPNAAGRKGVGARRNEGKRGKGAPLPPMFDARGKRLPRSMLGDVSKDPYADL